MSVPLSGKTALSSESNIAQLDDSDPFTSTELHKFNRQTRFFIRGIQITEGMNKDDAIKQYRKYKNDMPKHERQIYSKKVHKAIEDDSAGKRTKNGKFGKKLMMSSPSDTEIEISEDNDNEDNFEDFGDFEGDEDYE
jgi:hypothetical protein